MSFVHLAQTQAKPRRGARTAFIPSVLAHVALRAHARFGCGAFLAAWMFDGALNPLSHWPSLSSPSFAHTGYTSLQEILATERRYKPQVERSVCIAHIVPLHGGSLVRT